MHSKVLFFLAIFSILGMRGADSPRAGGLARPLIVSLAGSKEESQASDAQTCRTAWSTSSPCARATLVCGVCLSAVAATVFIWLECTRLHDKKTA